MVRVSAVTEPESETVLAGVGMGCGATRGELFFRFLHQRGIISNIPSSKPILKVVNTTSTRLAFQYVPKKKLTATSCWLFSAKAKSVKKMAALSSQDRYFT